jgi:hypothetical protein
MDVRRRHREALDWGPDENCDERSKELFFQKSCEINPCWRRCRWWRRLAMGVDFTTTSRKVTYV